MTIPAGARPPRPRNGKGRYIRAVENADRDRRAAQLITEGWTYQDAADHLGYPDRSSCWRAVQLVRRETTKLSGNSEQLRQQELAEMAELKRRLWRRLNHPLPAVSRTGKIVVDAHGDPVPDAAAVAAAEALLVRVSERIARIRGTDAPRRSVSLTGKAGVNEIIAVLEHANPEDLTEAIEIRRRELERAEREADEAEAGIRAIPGAIEP